MEKPEREAGARLSGARESCGNEAAIRLPKDSTRLSHRVASGLFISCRELVADLITAFITRARFELVSQFAGARIARLPRRSRQPRFIEPPPDPSDPGPRMVEGPADRR